MKKVLTWLNDEVLGYKVVIYVLVTLGIDFILEYSLVDLLSYLSFKLPPREPSLDMTQPYFPVLLFSFVAIEEFIFRLPLVVAIEVWGLSSKVLACAFGLSFVFGILHGNIVNLFAQGMGGICLSFLFLKCGGFRNNYVKAFLVTTSAHFIWNISIAIYLLSNGETVF